MSQVIISTIGTSLLTNQINRSNPEEKNWYTKVRDAANLTLEETPQEVLNIVEILKDRAIQKLEQSSTPQIRAASAELNGIYGFYKEQLAQGKQDFHWLVATDTVQGKETAKIVETFLNQQGITAQTYTPKGLSTASTRCFSEGIDDLIAWLEKTIDGYNKVCFNLVGGFKSLQAYLNTIGMFYADEIIYIFEGTNSEIIKIPRLPIKVDNSVIEPYVVEFALMDAGAGLLPSDVADVPESLVGDYDGKKVLSTWGELIWSKCKKDLLSNNLLQFPKLEYEDSFIRDYNKTRNTGEKVTLQEVLAKVSCKLVENNGSTASLKSDGGIQYGDYNNKGGIAHFRVTQSLRVSCVAEAESLKLRHYGAHDYVNDNP